MHASLQAVLHARSMQGCGTADRFKNCDDVKRNKNGFFHSHQPGIFSAQNARRRSQTARSAPAALRAQARVLLGHLWRRWLHPQRHFRYRARNPARRRGCRQPLLVHWRYTRHRARAIAAIARHGCEAPGGPAWRLAQRPRRGWRICIRQRFGALHPRRNRRCLSHRSGRLP